MIIIGDRKIGKEFKPLVIAEIGINHSGDIKKAYRLIDDAYRVGCEYVKFQCHIAEEEMIPVGVVVKETGESLWDIISKCELKEEEEKELKDYVEFKGMIYLSTPFSRAAADRLNRMNVDAYKIGSGECNNYPLIEHISKFGKPIILSTGMNNIDSIKESVEIIENNNVPYSILHCTSIYPTPYDKIRLGALNDIKSNFPNAVVGLSDHSIGNYSCFASIVYGASILEKHFVSSKRWDGPDISISIDPIELRDLIVGSNAIFKALGGDKSILEEERSVADFAYASIVSIKEIKKGEIFSKENIWVKRPGKGGMRASFYCGVLGMVADRDILKDKQIVEEDIMEMRKNK